MELKPVEITFSYVFNAKDWRAINIFRKKTVELLQTRFFSDFDADTNLKAKIEYDKKKGLSITADLPSEALLKELYMAFRFFYLHKEPSNFNRISKIIKRAANNEFVNRFVNHLKDQWSGALFRNNVFGIGIDNQEINAKRLLDLWFNAHYFHSDERKEGELEFINSILTTDFSIFMLANSVFEASNAVIRLYESIANLENPGAKKTHNESAL